MTPIPHTPGVRFPVRWLVLPLLAGTLGCAQTANVTKPSGEPAASRAPSPSGPAAAETSAPPDLPATHMGRKVLPRADVIVRGRVERVSAAAHGSEVGRVEPSEWLRGVPREEGSILVVLSVAAGALPLPGRDALFLLRSMPYSDNLELVEVGTLDDEDGPARLAAMKRFLAIEALADPAARFAALREYLRGALASEQGWTRRNAAREYAALAAEVPGSLTADDRAPLERALQRTTEKPVKALLESALAECPGTPSRPARPAAAPATDDAVAEYLARFDTKGSSAAARRQAVIDGSVALGVRATSLLERALADDDPRVREAAAAAAGQFRVASLEPRISAMLTADDSPGVRRTLVVAAGYLGSRSSVPTLALLAKDGGAFARDAAFALARIRDAAAMGELRRLRNETQDAERRGEIDFLLSDRFVEQEKSLAEKR